MSNGDCQVKLSSGQQMADDQRGAILVPAIVMGALLVGALFYVAGVGDAILFRTELQDAADVTAFKSAVWHARGMNVVAGLNILMSVFLAVFALLRALEIIALLAMAIIPIFPIALSIFLRLVSLEGTVAKFVDGGLEITKVTQQAVVVATPYAAAATATTTPTAADSVRPFSLALIPPVVDKQLEDVGQRSPSSAPAALPVQDDTFGRLCGKAGSLVPKLIGRFISGLLGDIADDEEGSDEIKSVVAATETAFNEGDGILCKPLTQIARSVASLLGTFFGGRKSGDDVCRDVERNVRDRARQERESAQQAASARRTGQAQTPAEDDGSRASRTAGPSRPSAGVVRGREAASKAGCGSTRSGSKSASKDGSKGGSSGGRRRRGGVVDGKLDTPPAKVWPAASNGNLFLHTWSYVTGTPRLFQADKDGISIAGGGREPEVELANSANAAAEYYFDCEAAWSDPRCGVDALWAPNWTARIRRYRGPIEQVLAQFPRYGTNLLDAVEEGLRQGPGAFVQDQLADAVPGALADFAKSQIEKIGFLNDVFASAADAFGDLRDRLGLDALLNPANAVDERRIH